MVWASGMKTSSRAVVWLPVPFSPATVQVSLMVHCEAGRPTIRTRGGPPSMGPGRGWPPSVTTQAPMMKSACSQPDENGHSPETR